MEQVIECMDKCCIANNMKENHERIHTLGEQDTSHSSEPEDICDSDIHQSPTAFPVACGDKKLDRSHVQHNMIQPFQFMTAADDGMYASDSCKSVIHSLSDIQGDTSNSTHFRVEDNFSRGENLSTVAECEDGNVSNLGHSQSELQNEQQQSDMSNTTFLSCPKDMSARVSWLCLLASRVKALSKVVRGKGIREEGRIFTMALYATRDLEKLYRHRLALSAIVTL